MSIFQRIATLMALLFASACHFKTPGGLLDSIPGPIFTSFSINGTAGVISDSGVIVDLRWTGISVTSAVATFVATGKNININSVTQVSNVTSNDFTKTKTYSMTGADSTDKSYKVTVLFGYPISDTGITACYDATTSAQPCASVSSTYPRQDANFADIPAARSFTGPTAHSTYISDYTTKDNITGLTWKSCSEGQSGSTCAAGSAGTFTLSPDTATPQCTALNSVNSGAGYAGRTNWRLPTVQELSTLPNYSAFNPAINNSNFPGTPVALYWTATTQAFNSANAFYVDFSDGTAIVNTKTSSLQVRCVSNGTASYAPPMKDNNDGTVTDLANNLTWAKCSMDNTGTGTLQTYASGCANLGAGSRTWAQALQDCNSLTFTGRSWRLPSVNEIKTVIDYSTYTPAMTANYFPNSASGIYWTSSTDNLSGYDFAKIINFNHGQVAAGSKATTYFARCVATGL